MKAIVVYYSLEGNTHWATQAIASRLGADTLRLETVVPYPASGARKFLLGGRDAMTGVKPELAPYAFDDTAYDTVILGTPLWAWTYAPALRTFLAAHDVKDKKLAFFVTSMGGQDGKCFAKLCADLNASDAPRLSLLEPLKRPKEDNDAAIDRFVREIQAL